MFTTETIKHNVYARNNVNNFNVLWYRVEGLGTIAEELIDGAGFLAALRSYSIPLTTIEVVRTMRGDPWPLVADLLLMRHHSIVRL